MRNLELITADVQDPAAKENFDRLQRLSDEDLFSKFHGKHIALTLSKNGTFLYQHNLGFKPTDFIQSAVITSGAATIVWNHKSFTTTHLSYTLAGLAGVETLVVRAFVGTYLEE